MGAQSDPEVKSGSSPAELASWHCQTPGASFSRLSSPAPRSRFPSGPTKRYGMPPAMGCTYSSLTIVPSKWRSPRVWLFVTQLIVPFTSRITPTMATPSVAIPSGSHIKEGEAFMHILSRYCSKINPRNNRRLNNLVFLLNIRTYVSWKLRKCINKWHTLHKNHTKISINIYFTSLYKEWKLEGVKSDGQIKNRIILKSLLDFISHIMFLFKIF